MTPTNEPGSDREDGDRFLGVPGLTRGRMAVGLGLLVTILGIAWWGDGEAETRDQGEGLRVPPSGAKEEPAGLDGGRAIDRAGAAISSRPRPFARKPGGDAILAVPRLSWMTRIRTNGILEAERVQSDPAYLRRVLQHDRLRVLLKSPARETPECDQVVAFVDRKGLPLSATVDLYNLVWATRDHERKWEQATEGERAAIEVVREMELTDFQRRFRDDFEVDVGPMLEELLAMPIRPEVFMGVPGRGFVAGEALLSE